jgi:hypothetical protein
MRNILFTLLFVLPAFAVSSQKVAISNDKSNVVYVGVPNLLTVTVENHSCESVVVKTDEGTLTRKDDDTYELMVTRDIDPTLEVFIKKHGKLRKVKEVHFETRRLNPVAKVGGKAGGVMPPTVFRAQLGLAAIMENFDRDGRYKITDFYMVVIRDGEVIFGHANEGARFDETIKNFMERVKKKDRIIFADIHAKAPDGSPRYCAPIVLRLEPSHWE